MDWATRMWGRRWIGALQRMSRRQRGPAATARARARRVSLAWRTLAAQLRRSLAATLAACSTPHRAASPAVGRSYSPLVGRPRCAGVAAGGKRKAAAEPVPGARVRMQKMFQSAQSKAKPRAPVDDASADALLDDILGGLGSGGSASTRSAPPRCLARRRLPAPHRRRSCCARCAGWVCVVALAASLVQIAGQGCLPELLAWLAPPLFACAGRPGRLSLARPCPSAARCRPPPPHAWAPQRGPWHPPSLWDLRCNPPPSPAVRSG